MGQQQSKTAFPLQPSFSQSQLALLEHPSFLTLRRTPFKNSTKISQCPALFLQSPALHLSLQFILSQRLNSTKLFTESDITNLTSTCLSALSPTPTYKDLHPSNIFYNPQSSTFKLYPPSLIPQSSYSLVLSQKEFRCIPPEMILAVRGGEREEELGEQMVEKGNVWMLGMMLLEVCTLREGVGCYDGENYDVLHGEVEERLEMVREFYPREMGEMLRGMLRYEWRERVGVKEGKEMVDQYLRGQGGKQEQGFGGERWEENKKYQQKYEPRRQRPVERQREEQSRASKNTILESRIYHQRQPQHHTLQQLPSNPYKYPSQNPKPQKQLAHPYSKHYSPLQKPLNPYNCYPPNNHQSSHFPSRPFPPTNPTSQSHHLSPHPSAQNKSPSRCIPSKNYHNQRTPYHSNNSLLNHETRFSAHNKRNQDSITKIKEKIQKSRERI